MTKKIAIQGFEGSFHQEAAMLYFGKDIEVICCATFKQTFAETKAKDCDGAVVAIENSNAGSILPNYNFLQKSNLSITGEVYLNIKQHLLANNNVTLEQIKEVHSHPMALLQCSTFLDNHHFKLIESEDTALSAKKIKQHQSIYHAAIASKLAAQIYGLNILVPNIHTDKYNTTRFLILSKNKNETTGLNKATLYFRVSHQTGSLANVLTKIAKHNINLSKLQSYPVSGSNFEYYFYADVEFEAIQHFNKMIEIIQPITTELRILGIYKNGKQ